MASWSVKEAATRLPAIVKAARAEAQLLLDGDKPAAVVLDAAEYERLKRIERDRAPTLQELLLATPVDDDPDPYPRAPIIPREVEF